MKISVLSDAGVNYSISVTKKCLSPKLKSYKEGIGNFNVTIVQVRLQSIKVVRKMNEKFLRGCMLFVAVCFLLLGFIYKGTADRHQGISVSTGVMIDDQYSEIDSGKIGEDREKYESFHMGGTIFYILAVVTGGVWVILSVKQKRDK